MTLYLASNNPAKLREFRDAAQSSGITLEPLPGIDSFFPCLEDGETFEANARKKALHYSRQKSGMIFADDSGLSVDALGGAPGVHSARYAGEAATYAENNRKLLDQMRGITAREAHFVCVIALAKSGKIAATFEGRANGTILETPRGHGGFGYDPLFFYPPLGKTFAELDLKTKFGVSHRGNAFRKLLEHLARS